MKQAIFTKSLTVSMPPEQYAKIKQITDEKRISMGEWAREAIAAALKGEGDRIIEASDR